MTLAHAHSLLAGVRIQDHPYTPDTDATALRRLAESMLRFAPVVSPDEPDGLMLDIAGCEQLFGGEKRHVRLIAETLRGWGLCPRLAVAPTTACAWAVARFGRETISWIAYDAVGDSLSPLPVSALRLDEQTIDALADVGIERIEHLVAQPRDELAARFGPGLLRRLDLATGVASETIRAIQPARRFETRHVFDGPVRKPEIIEATTRELLERLLAELRSVQHGVLELVVELRRVAVEPVTLCIRLTSPSHDRAHVWKLLSCKLERANLGYGVEEIALRAIHTGRMQIEQAAFLRDVRRNASTQSVAFGELVDRLIDRLGNEAVTRVRSVATYVPERAFVHSSMRNIAPSSLARTRAAEQALDPSHRPTQLFDTPEPVRIMSLVPDGPPIWLDWRGESAEVVSRVGPERIAFPWWTGRPAVRDYYEIEDEHGRRLWVFRDGASGHWFVHGEWT